MINKGAIAILLSTVYYQLVNKGWNVIPHGAWLIATHHSRPQSVYCITQATDTPQPLYPPVNQETTQIYALVLCPHGVTPEHLRQKHQKGIQFWFWDMRNGHIFPFPPTQSNEIHWLMAFLVHPDTDGEMGTSPAAERKPAQNHYDFLITYLILAINISLFGVMTLAGGTQDPFVLIRFGAKVNPLIQEGQIWRLVTCNFIHIGILHLAFNCYALWALGRYCEQLFGKLRYVVVYLAGGICGSLTSYLFSPAISAGASSAIFSILGALLIYSLNKPDLLRAGVTGNLVAIIAANFILGIMLPGIDNFAHLGGFATGVILGIILFGIRNPLLKKL